MSTLEARFTAREGGAAVNTSGPWLHSSVYPPTLAVGVFLSVVLESPTRV